METYQEMKERHQREFNALPIGAAFREEGFRRMMEGWGLTMEEVDKIYSIGHGCYIQKKDADLLHQTMERIDKEKAEALAADLTGLGYIKQMFAYELRNYECFYTGDVNDMLNALDLTEEQINADPRLKAGLRAAWKEGREAGL